MVLASLSDSQKAAYRLLIRHHVAYFTTHNVDLNTPTTFEYGMTVESLLSKCRADFIAVQKESLNTWLKEFEDHHLVNIVTENEGRVVYVPGTGASLQDLFEQI